MHVRLIAFSFAESLEAKLNQTPKRIAADIIVEPTDA